MIRRRRYVAMKVLLAVATAMALTVQAISAARSVQDQNEVAMMTKSVKTVCVGRFLVDLPKDAQVSLGRAAVDGFEISAAPGESESAFVERVARREAALKAERNEAGRPSLESVQAVKGEGRQGKIFVFGRSTTHVYHGARKVMLAQVAINAYVRIGATSFDIIASAYDPALAGNIVRLVAKLSARGDDEIPAEPGFCLGHGMVRDPLLAEQGERVVMFAGLSGHPDLAIAMSSMAGTRPGPGLLARNTASAAGQPALARALVSTLREGVRIINGLPGEELALRAREVNFASTYGFDWEMGGSEHDVLAPFVTLEMQSGLNPRAGGKPLQSTLSEAALLDLWDKILSSLRIRPASPPAPPKIEPVTPPLGTSASAGDTCPQTGWWQCGDAGKGIGVLGGQRQFLKKGQRMPQALLLPPQTLWQRVRGLQSSYESAAPTAWRLVDKRAAARVVPEVPLLPATVVERADAALAGAAGGMPGAQVGSFVKTGEPCPASGWWRCEEPRALDGTRWFSQGSLLPAATFRVPAGGFARPRLEVIHRRSMWQLVRLASAGEPAGPAQPA